tara:strand:- start:147 stop:368 length:222 start_codon:yes stop_codon:yes gene_type:complete
MGSYSFGIPSFIIYAQHIIIGLYFAFLGYKLIEILKFRMHGVILIGLGVLMFFYHAHLWYLSKFSKKKEAHYH